MDFDEVVEEDEHVQAVPPRISCQERTHAIQALREHTLMFWIKSRKPMQHRGLDKFMKDQLAYRIADWSMDMGVDIPSWAVVADHITGMVVVRFSEKQPDEFSATSTEEKIMFPFDVFLSMCQACTLNEGMVSVCSGLQSMMG